MNCPLTGKPCSLKKVIFATEMENNNVVRELELCQQCGQDYLENPYPKLIKIDHEPETTEIKIITNLDELYEIIGIEPTPLPPPKDPCPGCGLTLDEFNRIGKFGCSECYDHYLDEFEALAGPFHGNEGSHLGKTPKRQYEDTTNPVLDELKTLRLKLVRAVEHEKYEEAADLQKKLNDLELLLRNLEEIE